MKGHFSWDAFLNVWKRLLLVGVRFAGARAIDLAMLSLEHETFFTNGALVRMIHSACSFAMQRSFWELRRNFFFALCLSCTCRALPRVNLHISVFRTCAPRPRVALVSSSTKALATLWEKLERLCLLLFFFFINERIWNFRERLSVFPECPIDFDDFPEQIR